MLLQPRLYVPYKTGKVLTLSLEYYQRVLNASSNLIGLWRLNETSGTTINDISGNGLNGTYTGVTLNDTTSPDGQPAAKFTASSSYGNLYSASLAGYFDDGETFSAGSMMVWIKVDSARWTDGQARVILEFGNSGSNKLYLLKSNTNNTLAAFYARSTQVSASFSTSSTNWLNVFMTWSAAGGYVRIYVNGAAGTQYSGSLTAITGGLTSSRALIGADSTVGSFAHLGHAALAALWGVSITDTNVISSLATV